MHIIPRLPKTRFLLGLLALLFAFPAHAKRDHRAMLKRLNKGAKHKVHFVSRYQLNPSFVIEKYKLSNGLAILLLEDHAAPVFAYHTWFKVGSRHERKGKTGIAHLFEHLLFKATKHLKDGEFDKIMERNGAVTNAATWVDWTFYLQSLPAGKLPLVTRLEADRMQNMILNKKQLESERKVVKNERRLRVDNDPSGKMSELLYHKAFRVHPYGWPTIGWMKDLDAITLQDCLAFYKMYYAPNNATVVIVGDFRTEEALKLLMKRYGHIPAQPIAAERKVTEPPQTKPIEHTVHLPIQAPKVAYGFHSPALQSKEHATLQILDQVLTGGTSSRLYKLLVLQKELVSKVSSYVNEFSYPGLYELWLNLKKGKRLKTVHALITQELQRIGQKGISAQELTKAKNRLAIQFFRKLTTVGKKAYLLGHFETTTGDFRLVFQTARRLQSVSAAEVKALAAKLFSPNNRTLIRGLPLKKKPKARPKARPKAKSLTARAQSFTVNGIKVILVPKTNFDYVTFDLTLKVGSLSDPAQKEGLAALYAQMLLKGTTKRTQAQLAEQIEILGSTLKASTGRRTITLRAEALGRNVDAFFALFAEVLQHPSFLAKELAKRKRLTRARLENIKENDGTLVRTMFRSFLFGLHPLGRPVRGSLQSLKQIQRAQLLAFHKRHMRTSNLLLGVTGNITKQRLTQLLQTHLKHIPRGHTPTLKLSMPRKPQKRRILFIDKPARTQTQILIGHLGIPLHHPDAFALLVANTIFGGTFTSRLMQEIREKRGWSYGAYSSNLPHRRTGVFLYRFAPATKDAVNAINLSLKLYQTLISKGLSDKELAFAKSYIANSFKFKLDTPRKQLQQLLQIELSGLSKDYLDTFLARVQAVTRADIQRALRNHLSSKDLIIVVVGTWSRLKQQIKRIPNVSKIFVHPYNKPWKPTAK